MSDRNTSSNQYVGAERFMSDDARGVLCVRAEHYEALRQRFEKACARVTELESAVETPAPREQCFATFGPRCSLYPACACGKRDAVKTSGDPA